MGNRPLAKTRRQPRQAKEGKGTTVPEGNEIHRFAKLHTETFVGKTICVESPNGRFPGAALLTGRKLKAVIAHGKHLAYDFGRDRKLHIHLGRFGDFTEGKMPFPEVKGILRMRWSTATDWLELRGATDVSVYSDAQWQAVRDRLGADGPSPIEELEPQAPALEHLNRRLRTQSSYGRSRPIY